MGMKTTLQTVFVVLLFISPKVFGLGIGSSSQRRLISDSFGNGAIKTTKCQEPTITRRSSLISIASSSFLLITSTPPPSIAATTTTPTTIDGCPLPISGKPNNCVSTASIKQIDNYTPPWTFNCSPDEAFARLKGVIATDSLLSISAIDEEARYLKVDVTRNLYTKDEIEFLVRGGDDNVVTFRAMGVGDQAVSDFGAIRKKVEGLRQTAGGVFGVMGEGIGSADSYYGGQEGRKGKGPLGQLKAFYGLQSGEGFEDVFD